MELEDFLNKLESGELRSAKKVDGKWVADQEVKKMILEVFKAGKNVQMGAYVDKHNIPAREISPEDGIRMVPRGSAIRRGSYVASGVIMMPPAYVNIGAYVDTGSMIDSHALVGSCAQIGKNVHLSAGVQIGGVLEPIGANPVVIEDNAFIGAGSVIVEGVVVGKGAVIAAGVTLSKGVPVYDVVNQRVLEKGEPIPENAIVIAGTRPVGKEWANEKGLSLNCAIIVKYRDEKSEASLALEDALR